MILRVASSKASGKLKRGEWFETLRVRGATGIGTRGATLGPRLLDECRKCDRQLSLFLGAYHDAAPESRRPHPVKALTRHRRDVLKGFGLLLFFTYLQAIRSDGISLALTRLL